MDDFDYSVQISELDWNTFFQECEECDLLPPALAGLEDSGMSDADDTSSSISSRDPLAVPDTDLLEPDESVDGPPDSEGCPVEHYFSTCDLTGPEDVLSCSEEDRHLESVNIFFEKLKNITEGGNIPVETKPRGTRQEEDPAGPIDAPVSKTGTGKSQGLIGGDSTVKETEDEVDRSASLTVALVIREEEQSVKPTIEERKQEKEVQSHEPSKDALLRSESMSSLSSNSACGNTPTERKLQGSEVTNQEGEDGAIRGHGMPNQPPLTRSSSLSSPHNELHPDQEAQVCVGTAQKPEHNPVMSPKKKQKECWFVSVGGSQESSRQQGSPLKKKRKKFGTGRESLGLGHGFEELSTESETEADRCAQGAAGQGKGLAKHEGIAGRDETASEQCNFSAEQMAAEKDVRKKEKITTKHHLKNHSQQNSKPANKAENDNLSAFQPTDNIPQNFQSDSVMVDSTSQQFTGMPDIERSGGAEQCFAKESHRMIILQENPIDQKQIKRLQVSSEEGEKVGNQQESLELSGSTESQQCDKSFICDTVKGSEDSMRLDLPGLGDMLTQHTVNNSVLFSQEKSDLDNTSPDMSPPKEFLVEAPYLAELPESTRSSLSLNNIGSQGSSWFKMTDPAEANSAQDEEMPPEYQEVENVLDTPIDNDNYLHPSNSEDSQIGNIISQNNSTLFASENNEPTSYLLSEEPKMPVERTTSTQSDLTFATPLPGTCSTPVHLPPHSFESSTENYAIDSKSMKSEAATLPVSEKEKGKETADPLLAKFEYMTQTDTAECVNMLHSNSLQSSKDVTGDSEVETIFKQELQDTNNPPEGTSLVHTSEFKTDSNIKKEPSFPPEPTAGTKPLEAEKALDSTHPVYAMSSFWQEMEKLTINDILRLRLVSNAQSPGGLPHPQDIAMTPTSEAADSGYSFHLEDSKPDRSSGEISTISDFEEECLLSHNGSINSSPEPQVKGQRSLGSSSSRGILWESEPDTMSLGVDNDLEMTGRLLTEETNSPLFLSNSAQQGFRRMCKNISVQNLRALDAEPRVNQVLRNASLHTAVNEEEDSIECSGISQKPEESCSTDPVESRNNAETPFAPSLSGDVFTEGYTFSFPEIFEYLFGPDETKPGLADTGHKEVPIADESSVPEMYDHFFSDFETGNFFFPFIQGSDDSQKEPVPIFSCSRASSRNLQFPEAYDYFFPDDSPVESSEDEDDHNHDQAPMRVVTRFDKVVSKPQETVAALDMYEHFFADNEWRENLFWRNPLSFRRISFTSLTGSRKSSTSSALVPIDNRRNTVLSPIYPDSAVDSQGTAHPQLPLYCLEERIFRELAEQQRRYANLQNAIAIPNGHLLSLKQSDMCLICIAFASWVLKTANPQDADTWKATLLANISALSAIRFLRRYVREESATNKS